MLSSEEVNKGKREYFKLKNLLQIHCVVGGRCGRDRMVVGFTLFLPPIKLTAKI